MFGHDLTTIQGRIRFGLRVVIEVFCVMLLYTGLVELSGTIGVLPTVLYTLGVGILLIAVVYLVKEHNRKKRRPAAHRNPPALLK